MTGNTFMVALLLSAAVLCPRISAAMDIKKPQGIPLRR